MALSTRMASELPRKIGRLAQAISQAKSRPSEPGLLRQAHAQALKLRATAGAAGLAELLDAAGLLETGLSKLRSGDHGSTLAWAEVEQALMIAAQVADTAANEVTERRLATSVPLRSARVLVVSTDAPLLQLMDQLGRQMVLEVVAVSSAAQALRSAREVSPQVAFLDSRLSGVSDIELATELRGVPGCGTLPLAFLSGDGGVEHRIAAARAGASLYLPRPVQLAALDAAVRQMVEKTTDALRVLVIGEMEEAQTTGEAVPESVAPRLCEAGMLAVRAANAARVLELLEASPPDLVLFELRRVTPAALDVCRMLRADPRWQDLPIFLLVEQAETELRVDAFFAGADDIMPRPLAIQELLTKIRMRVERLRLQRERSERDGLTGLLLRRPFLERLTTRLAEAKRHVRPLTLCLLDLDGFKKINDTFGHGAGDRVLTGLGKLLAGRLRAEDLRGRWGGEEIVLAFFAEGVDTIQGVMTTLLRDFGTLCFATDHGGTFSASFSAGMATFPDDGAAIEDLVRAADRRLYRAKHAGRNRVISWD